MKVLNAEEFENKCYEGDNLKNVDLVVTSKNLYVRYLKTPDELYIEHRGMVDDYGSVEIDGKVYNLDLSEDK